MFMTLFRNGGFGMYPVLVLGLVSLATAGFFAARGDGKIRGFLDAIDKALLWAVIGATTSNFMTVFHVIANDEMSGDKRAWILAMGSYEALSPVAMGGAFLMLTYVFVAVGQRRVDARVA
jgi:hypothetical protein